MVTEAESTEVFSFRKHFDQLQNLGSSAAFLGGLLYSVGLLIVNIDLGRYGLAGNLDLARPEYIVAGASWAFLTAATLTSLRFCLLYISGARHLSFHLKAIMASVGVVASLLVPVCLITLLAGSDVATAASGLKGAAAIDFNAVVVGLGFWVSTSGRSSSNQADRFTFEPMYMVAYVLVFWFLALSLYARYSFRLLPTQFGGGRRPVVSVILKPDVTLPNVLHLNLLKNGKEFGPVKLLYETDHALIVCFPDPDENQAWVKPPMPAAFSINKDLIVGIVYVSVQSLRKVTVTLYPGEEEWTPP